MNDIAIFKISPFFCDDDFIKIMSMLCKSSLLQSRTKKINKIRSSQMLKKRISDYSNSISHINNNMLIDDNYEIYELYEILKDLIEDLFCEVSLERSDIGAFNKHKINFDKYCCSNTIFYYYKVNKIPRIDFTSHQSISYNVKLCSTYRMGCLQKRILMKNYPYAKALIY